MNALERRLLAVIDTAEGYEQRLDALRELAEFKIERPPDWDHQRERERDYSSGNVILSPERCYLCCVPRSERRLYWHHAIQIQHGGSNHSMNKVPLCLRCHARVHPWLPAEREGEDYGFSRFTSDDARRFLASLVVVQE